MKLASFKPHFSSALLCVVFCLVSMGCVHRKQKAVAFSKLYKNALELQKKPNPIFEPSPNVQLPTLPFLVEIPAGSYQKNEFRTATGQLILDRTLCKRPVHGSPQQFVQSFPANYGMAPGRFSEDGDPLDFVVLGRSDMYRKQVQQGRIQRQYVRVVGLMKMEECEKVPCKEKDWERDWKVLGVDPTDTKYKNVKDISQLPREDKKNLSLFFSNYKGPKKGFPQTRVTGYLSQKEAIQYIAKMPLFSAAQRQQELAQCRRHNAMLLERMPRQPKFDPIYLKCIERVFDANFFKTQQHLKYFLKYTAFQILKKRKKFKGTLTLDNSVALMATLKAKRKKHHRFVIHDNINKGHNPKNYASNGTGQLILEWVKTKNRNKNCPVGFKTQHYESYDLTSGL